MTDIEIAKQFKLKNIVDIASKLNLEEDEIIILRKLTNTFQLLTRESKK